MHYKKVIYLVFTRILLQTDSGTHSASYEIGTGGSFPGLKRPVRKSDNSLQSSAKVKNAWSYIAAPPYIFMTWCSVKHGIRLHCIILI
jgi:hypothetical protein